MTPTDRIRYSGRTTDSREHAVGQACKVEVQGDASGILRLQSGATPDELIVYEEGVGCVVRARRSAGQIFKADVSDCELSDTGIRELGVIARHYAAFQIDLAAKTWSCASMATRADGPEGTVEQCFHLTADLSGELPVL